MDELLWFNRMPPAPPQSNGGHRGAKEGFSVSQFLVSAAGEKLAVMLTMDYLRREANTGRREDFERYLAAVPDTEPELDDRLD